MKQLQHTKKGQIKPYYCASLLKVSPLYKNNLAMGLYKYWMAIEWRSGCFTFELRRMRWGLSLLGMTEIPCCVWYLSNTWDKVSSVVTQHSHKHTSATKHSEDLTNLGRAQLVLLGYLLDNRVLQQLVRVEFTSKPKINQKGGFICFFFYFLFFYF